MSGVQTSFRAGRWLGAAWQKTLPGSDVLNWEVDAASRWDLEGLLLVAVEEVGLSRLSVRFKTWQSGGSVNGDGQPKGADIWKICGFFLFCFSDRKTLTFLCEVTFSLLSARMVWVRLTQLCSGRRHGLVSQWVAKAETVQEETSLSSVLMWGCRSRMSSCHPAIRKGVQPGCSLGAGSRGERELLDHQPQPSLSPRNFCFASKKAPFFKPIWDAFSILFLSRTHWIILFSWRVIHMFIFSLPSFFLLQKKMESLLNTSVYSRTSWHRKALTFVKRGT